LFARWNLLMQAPNGSSLCRRQWKSSQICRPVDASADFSRLSSCEWASCASVHEIKYWYQHTCMLMDKLMHESPFCPSLVLSIQWNGFPTVLFATCNSVSAFACVLYNTTHIHSLPFVWPTRTCIFLVGWLFSWEHNERTRDKRARLLARLLARPLARALTRPETCIFLMGWKGTTRNALANAYVLSLLNGITCRSLSPKDFRQSGRAADITLVVENNFFIRSRTYASTCAAPLSLRPISL
jgi:hypothetical protein